MCRMLTGNKPSRPALQESSFVYRPSHCRSGMGAARAQLIIFKQSDFLMIGARALWGQYMGMDSLVPRRGKFCIRKPSGPQMAMT